MNRTKIEYGEMAWNPITGCEKGCSYCWARKTAKRFYPHIIDDCLEQIETLGTVDLLGEGGDEFQPIFWLDRLDEPLLCRKPKRILVSFMGDMWGGWIPAEWIRQVLAVTKEAAERMGHTFVFLTKNPKRYAEFAPFPKRHWLGTTITGVDDTKQIFELMRLEFNTTIKYVSFEPLLAPVDDILDQLRFMDWVIVGAQTRPTIQPKHEWVQRIIDACYGWDEPMCLFLKNNLHWPGVIQNYPKEVVDAKRAKS